MKAKDLEQSIFDLEKIRVVVRANNNVEFQNYNWVNRADEGSTITNWISNRIKPTFGDFPVVVIDGYGGIPHGGTTLKKLRLTYRTE